MKSCLQRIYSSTTIIGGYEMQKYGVLLFLMMTAAFLLGGCFQGEQNVKEIDVPEEVEVIDEEEADDTEEELDGEEVDETDVVESDETVAREIYVLDQDGMVVPQTFELPKSESAAMQVLEYMVVDGPITEHLPSGFQAVLPAETTILGVNLKEDGTLIVDVSEEFEQYEAENELNIIEAMTHTLTQFTDVERIKLWVNGYEQTEMPVNGTPISEGYSKSNGINIITPEQIDLMNSKVATVYLPKQLQEELYYVPVTKYFKQDDQDMLTEIVEALVTQSITDQRFVNVFNDETTLLNTPTVDDGVVQLEFSEHILQEEEHAIIANDVMETLVRTLTEQDGIEAVEVTVDNHGTLINEDGHKYKQPVTKESFAPSEKM